MQIIKKNGNYSRIKADISDNKVGILLDRNASLLLALYCCYKQGITYIPFDPKWPNERIQMIVQENSLRTIITQEKYRSRVNCSQVIILGNEEGVEFIGQFQKNEISYVLYTSGSTGNPKGVEIKKESLLNFIDGISEKIDFSPSRRIACLTTVTFDIFFLESTMSLEKGLTIVLADESEQSNPKLIKKLIEENNIDIIQMTPSRIQLLLNFDPELSCLKDVKDILIGGEPFPNTLLQILQQKTNAHIYNMYGPTETTIWSTLSDLTYEEQVNIGKPIKNTEVFIINEDFSMTPKGQIGEICIGGKGVAKGYVGKNMLSDKKFINLPQSSNIRIYRTGDFGKYLPDGNIQYIGRIDNQIKIRGRRVELEEIETQLNQIKPIKQSIVISKNNDGVMSLKAYYTSEEEVDEENIIRNLSRILPEYMIPVTFERVENFIQTSNGKIDRKRISECEVIGKTVFSERNENSFEGVESAVIKVINQNVGKNFLSEAHLETKLKALGLDSINFVNMIIELENVFDIEFEDEMLLLSSFSTIESMVRYIESKIE